MSGSKADNPPIKAAKTMKKLMADHFMELEAAAKDGSAPIAWCTSVGPAELLVSMGFKVFFPENHGALLGATRMATDLIPKANAIGYSPEICSYLTADVGAFLAGKTPLAKAYGIESPPKPDVLVFNTNQCRDVQDWFRFYANHWNVPLTGVFTHREIGDVEKHHVADIVAQFKELIPILEAAGGKFDIDRFREVVGLSAECSKLWRAVLETSARTPAPWTFFDHTIFMGPGVVMRGRKATNEYFIELLAELNQRADEGLAAVPGERHRFYWDGMPIWGKLRANSDMFKAAGAAIVASTYCNSWIFDSFDPDDPFESTARAYLELFIVRNEVYKEAYIRDHVERYKINGLIYHDAKTCPNNSNNRYGMPERLARELGIPTLTINGDLNDLRCYSEEQTRTNIEAFIEQLDEAAA